MNFNTSYIANLNLVKQEHLDIKQDLTNRAFPCIISNEILMDNDTLEYPNCSLKTALVNTTNKVNTIRDSSLAYFLFFIDDSLHNDIAAFELGLAIGNIKTLIVLIGPRLRHPIHFLQEINSRSIIRAYDYEGFITQRFFDKS